MQVGINWGGNYSRFTFDEAMRYFYMLKVQGVPVLDDEFNIAQEIILTFLRRLIQDVVGDGSLNNCFDIASNAEAQNDFIINGGDGTLDGAGHYYLDGYLIVLPSDTTFLNQPISQSAITVPVGARTDEVYLDVYFDEIDTIEDSNIKDPTLALETSRRLKLQWEVKVAEGSATPAPYADANSIDHVTIQIGLLQWVSGALSVAGNGWTSTDKTLFIRSYATSDIAGLIELATESETRAGIDSFRALTPATLASAITWTSATLIGTGLAFATGISNLALAALNGSDVVFIERSINELRTYRFNGSTWAQVGNGLVLGDLVTPALAALNGTDVALVADIIGELRTYRFDGLDWSQVGTGLAVSGNALAALNGTDVALASVLNNELRTYRFNGSTWAQVGNGKAIVGGIGTPALAALNGTDVALASVLNNELRTYRFDGSDWSQIGIGLIISNLLFTSLAPLNRTDVAFIDDTTKEFRTYRFDGSDWFQIGIGLAVSGNSKSAITTLNGTDVVFIDTSNEELRTYRFGFHLGNGPYHP